MSFIGSQSIGQIIERDEYGVSRSGVDGYSLSGSNSSEFLAGADQYGVLHNLRLVEDNVTENLWRAAITGKVSVEVASTPTGGTPVHIAADTPLAIKNQLHYTNWTIPTGKTLYIQQIVIGCQGDPQADGSKVEVYFNDGTDHLISRVYVVGASTFDNFPDTNETRDGTIIIGNGTNYISIGRIRLSVSSQEIDALLKGYLL